MDRIIGGVAIGIILGFIVGSAIGISLAIYGWSSMEFIHKYNQSSGVININNETITLMILDIQDGNVTTREIELFPFDKLIFRPGKIPKVEIKGD